MNFNDRIRRASNNNADLYEAVFSASDIPYKRLPFAFVGLEIPPPYYSNLTTLSSEYVGDQLSELKFLAEYFGGAVGVKDSFCMLDLAAHGFEEMLAAEWVWCEPDRLGRTLTASWLRVEAHGDLELWERAWKRCGSPANKRIFNPAILKNPGIAFFGRRQGERFDAGCIANVSPDCIGLSNVFAEIPSRQVFSEAATVATSIDNYKPLVGYLAGPPLHWAHETGFKSIGPLRVLKAEAARF